MKTLNIPYFRALPGGEPSPATAVTATRAAGIPGWTLTSLALPVLLSSLAAGIGNVALPALSTAFDAPFQRVQWVVLAYLLAVTTLIVAVGRLGDLLGRRRLLLAGLGLFTAASAGAAVAPSLGALMAARAFQGVGAAAMLALSLALVGETAPKEKTGQAMGLLGTMSAVGTALGPSLGGLLLAESGWRAVFLALVPLGLMALLLVRRVLPVGGAPRGRGGKGFGGPSGWAAFDGPGVVLLALTLAAYCLALSTGGRGIGSGNLTLLLVAALLMGLFVLAERRALAPLVPLALLRERRRSGGLVATLLVAAVAMATLVVGPFHLTRVLGLTMGEVGLVLSTGPLVAALTGVPAGALVDRFGARRMSMAGLAGMALGSSALAWWSGRSGLPGFLLPTVVLTAHYALFQAANNTASLAGIGPEERGVASGLLNLARNLGLITGTALLGAVFAFGSGTDAPSSAPAAAVATGLRLTFTVATGLLLLASVVLGMAGAVPRPPRGSPTP